MAGSTPEEDRDREAKPADKGDKLFPPHQPYPPEQDGVDEASEESFPASDAPSTWSRQDN